MKISSIIFSLCLCIITFDYASADENSNGTFSGQLLLKTGVPMSHGTVNIFNAANLPAPLLGKYWRIPDETVDTDKSGKFTISLPAGKYYFAAIQRNTNERLGPPVAGDYFFASRDTKGNYISYEVKSGSTTLLPAVTGISPIKRSDVVFKGKISGIAGVVRNIGGKPIKDALVVAYDNPEMQGPPKFSAVKTGSNGKYILGVDQAGSYYIRVRSIYGGGKPEVGDLIGTYGELKNPRPVIVESNKVTNKIDITVEKFKGSMAPQ